MPEMGGLEVTQLVRQHERDNARPRTPIFALTAAAMPEEKEAGLRAGLDLYLTKPIRRADFYDAVDRLALSIHHDTDVANMVDYYDAMEDIDQDVFEIIGEDYLLDALKAIASFDAPSHPLNWVELARIAHTQKGLVANFNATLLQSLWSQMELAAREGRIDPFLLAQVREEFSRLQLAIRSRLGGAA